MENFYVSVISIEEKGAGILHENDCAVLLLGLRKCLTLPDVEKRFPIGSIATGEAAAFVEKGKVLYIDKRKNPDLVKAVRTALCFGAVGVVVPFGNNVNRPYIREGRAYDKKELTAAIGEIKRLAPLFGRKFTDISERQVYTDGADDIIK